MPEEPYSKRELDHYFTDLREKFLATINGIASDVVEIKDQTKKTNGRVSKLEGWRNFILGMATLFVVVVMPLLGILFENMRQKVDRIDKILSQYEITIEK